MAFSWRKLVKIVHLIAQDNEAASNSAETDDDDDEEADEVPKILYNNSDSEQGICIFW